VSTDLVFHIKERTQTGSVCEQDAEENTES